MYVCDYKLILCIAYRYISAKVQKTLRYLFSLITAETFITNSIWCYQIEYFLTVGFLLSNIYANSRNSVCMKAAHNYSFIFIQISSAELKYSEIANEFLFIKENGSTQK